MSTWFLLPVAASIAVLVGAFVGARGTACAAIVAISTAVVVALI